MSVLKNPKHEKFVQEIVKGASQRDAYKAAGYDAKTDAAADAAASRLLSDVKIRARLNEFQEKAAEKALLSKKWVIERLVENVERAMQAREVLMAGGEGTGEYKYEGSVANRALELLGKEMGMFVDRKEVGLPGDFSRMSDEDLRQHVASETRELGIAKPLSNGKLH